MTDLEDILAGLWSRLHGCQVAAVVGMDGLLIERHPAPTDQGSLRQSPPDSELDHVAADLTSSLTQVAGEMSRQLAGRIDELIALGENGGYLARRVGDDLFCFVMVNASSDLGSVRREVEAVSRELLTAFA